MPKSNLERKYATSENEIIGSGDELISVVLARAVERVSSLTSADGAAIALSSPQGVFCGASAGNAPSVGSRLDPDSAFTEECLRTSQVVLCEDAENDSRVLPSTAKSLQLRSAVAVPIQAKGSILGIVEVFSSRPYAFDTTHVAGVQRIAALLAPILRLRTEQLDAIGTGGPFVPAQTQPASLGEEQFIARRPLTLVPPVPVGDSSRADGRGMAPSNIRRRGNEKSTRALWLPAVAVGIFLLFLLFVGRQRSVKVPSIAIPPAASSAARPGQALEQTRAASRDETQAVSSPDRSSRIEVPSPSTPSSTKGKEERLAIAGENLKLPAGPVDQNKTSASTPIRARLPRDQADSKVLAKTDPPTLPILIEPAKAPALELASPVAPALKSTNISIPAFMLERTFKGHTSWVTSVAFTADAKRLASGSWDQTVRFWDVLTGREVSKVGRKVEVQALAISGDGKWLATEDSADTVTLWNAINGAEVRTLPGNKSLGVLGSSWVYSIAFSPNGRWLASGVDDKTVRLWDVTSGHVVRDFAGSRRSVIYIAFSPDSRLLATGDSDKNITVWDVASGQQIRKLSGHKKPIYAVAFSPNGRWLVSGSADKSVKVWDVATGREIRTLKGHENTVSSLAFSPDGRLLASGSWDKTIKVWDVEAGRELQTLAGSNHRIYTVAFDSHGRWIASGSEDGTIKLWRLGGAADQSRLR